MQIAKHHITLSSVERPDTLSGRCEGPRAQLDRLRVACERVAEEVGDCTDTRLRRTGAGQDVVRERDFAAVGVDGVAPASVNRTPVDDSAAGCATDGMVGVTLHRGGGDGRIISVRVDPVSPAVADEAAVHHDRLVAVALQVSADGVPFLTGLLDDAVPEGPAHRSVLAEVDPLPPTRLSRLRREHDRLRDRSHRREDTVVGVPPARPTDLKTCATREADDDARIDGESRRVGPGAQLDVTGHDVRAARGIPSRIARDVAAHIRTGLHTHNFRGRPIADTAVGADGVCMGPCQGSGIQPRPLFGIRAHEDRFASAPDLEAYDSGTFKGPSQLHAIPSISRGPAVEGLRNGRLHLDVQALRILWPAVAPVVDRVVVDPVRLIHVELQRERVARRRWMLGLGGRVHPCAPRADLVGDAVDS